MRTPTFVDDHLRSRNSLHSAMLFFAVIGADVDELDGFSNVVAKTLFVAGTIGNESVQDELFDMGRDISLYLGCIPAVGERSGVNPGFPCRF
jgi:hypothetical protein